MTDDDLVDICRRATSAVVEGLSIAPDWGLVPGSAHQHHSDLAADAAAVGVLVEGGLGVLSEESGVTRADRPLWAVLDPLDGSTNAAQGIPWYACSLCVVDGTGPRVALVTNLATGVEYRAVRGGGAWRCDPVGPWPAVGVASARPADAPSSVDARPADAPGPAGAQPAPDPAGPAGARWVRPEGGLERRLRSSGRRSLGEAVVGVSGLPRRHLGWGQFRALGAAALDLCAVAEGALDGWIDCSPSGHGVWDYLGGLLVCRESGASVAELGGEDLVHLDHAARRWPAAGASPELLARLTDVARAG